MQYTLEPWTDILLHFLGAVSSIFLFILACRFYHKTIGDLYSKEQLILQAQEFAEITLTLNSFLENIFLSLGEDTSWTYD